MADNATFPPEPPAPKISADHEAAELWRLLDADAGDASTPPWPHALRATVELMLPSKAQMVLFWGPEFTTFYNDAYAPFIGGLHPRAFGRSSRKDWSDLWDDLVPLLERVYQDGETVAVSDRAFQMERNGAAQEAFFDINFSPVRDEDGAVGGVLCVVTETTAKVQALRALSENVARQKEADQQQAMALGSGAVRGTWMWDIPADHLTGDERFAQAFSLDAAALRGGLPMEQVLAQIHTSDRAAVWQALKQAVAGSGTYCAEYRVHVDAEGWRWMESSGHVERSVTGTPLRLPGVLVDVDARHQAQGELQLVHEQLRATQNGDSVGLFAQDLASGQLTVSPEFCLLYGLPVTPVVTAAAVDGLGVSGAHWRVRHHAAGGSEGGRGEAALDVEYQVRRADTGALHWVARRARFLCDADGRPVQMHGVVQDVTGKKDAEAALLASKASFGALARSVPMQIWTGTADGRIDWCNQYVLDYAGVARAQLADGGWTQLVHPGDLPRVGELRRRGLARQSAVAAEFRLRRHDGVYRWHLVRAEPVPVSLPPQPGQNASLKRWIGTNTDIDGQKTVQHELTRRNAALQRTTRQRVRDHDRLWRLSSDLMVVVHLDGSIVAANPAWQQVLGWSEAELLGRNVNELVHPDDSELTAGQLQLLGQAQAQAQTAVRFEKRYRHKDGSWRAIAWCSLRDGLLVHSIGRDVTAEREAAAALRETEAQLRQSQKMEALGQLTGGIAHDFNNLLQGITSAIELVRRRIAQSRTEDLDRFMDNALHSARRAASITQRLLAFSRRQPLNTRPVDVNALLLPMEDLLRSTLGEGIRLVVLQASDLQLALADESQLESAVLNLAINARDAMPDGGQLTIETRNTELDAAYARLHAGVVPGHYVAIAISDTGTGMPSEVLEKAFDPFFTTKSIGHGTGLGLSMVYGFAKQLGGHAHIYSEVGTGTTISLYLPQVAAPEASFEASEVLAPERGAGEVVLVVEDDPAVRLMVLAVLADQGYTTLEAADGDAAVQILASDAPIDLLLTDIGLPGLGGQQVADKARQHHPGLKVLFMTGYAGHATTHAELLGPGMQMIVKPFAVAALEQAIGQVMQKPASAG